MNLDDFYSKNPVSSWKVVLGDDLHYHFGAGGEKPFEKTVLNLLEFLPPNSKILDCGCGWGGPGKLMLREGHQVTGVTISKTQADHIKEFPAIHADLHEFHPKEEYDAAVFIESYFHLTDPRKVFDNLIPSVKHIVIADFVCSPEFISKEWGVTIKPKFYMFGNLSKVGYVVEQHYERLDFWKPSLKYWRENFDKLPEEEIYGQIKQLREFCDAGLKDGGEIPNIRQIFVHARRR